MKEQRINPFEECHWEVARDHKLRLERKSENMSAALVLFLILAPLAWWFWPQPYTFKFETVDRQGITFVAGKGHSCEEAARTAVWIMAIHGHLRSVGCSAIDPNFSD